MCRARARKRSPTIRRLFAAVNAIELHRWKEAASLGDSQGASHVAGRNLLGARDWRRAQR